MDFVGRLRADKFLRTLRAHPEPGDRSHLDARRGLEALGDAALPPLFEALRNPELRVPAAGILAGLVDDRTLPTFLKALASPDPTVAGTVTDLLARARSFEPARLLDLLIDPSVPKARLETVLASHMERIDARALVSMIGELAREPRAIVFRLLEQHADADVVLESLRFVDDPDWWVRHQMARLLSRVRARPGVEALVRLLADSNRSVRLEAARSAGRLRDSCLIAPLCHVLRDGDIRVQTAAIDALVSIGDPAAVPHLVEVLKDESEVARRGAVEVLNEVVTVEAIKDLVLALRDEDWWVRARAADALGSLGGEKVVEAVLGILTDEDEFVRRYAVEILNTVTDPRAVGPLIRALDDEDWWVRERAIDALARTGDPRAVDPIIDLMWRDANTLAIGLRALKQFADLRTIPVFGRLLNSERPDLRREAIEALLALIRSDLPPDDRAHVLEILKENGIEPARRGARPVEIQVRSPRAFPESGKERPSPRPDGDAAASPGSGPAGPEPGGPPRAARRDFSDLPPGELLGERYRVIRRIGGGGFGTVYLVEDRLIRDELILKVLNPHLSGDQTMTRRFIQELRLTRRISHPGVIRIHEMVEVDGLHGITMEYFRSRDLATLLRSGGPLSPERGIAILAQVCDALAAAHELGTIHRDIKPANILIGENDQVKVVDFGLAAASYQAGSRLTRTGLLIGTPEYMAPEQITEGRIDRRADLYSLGVVMYETFSGVSPFAGESAANVLFRHIEAEVAPLRQVAPAVSEGLEAVVMSAMARDPGERPAGADEIARRLREQAGPLTPGEAAA